ncbi:hypothetical protein Tco_0054611 [Tanacetum coccineum]
MVYTGDDGQALFTSHAWRRLFKVRGPLVREFILEFLSTCRMSDIEMGLDVADTLCFQLGEARRRMTLRQFILALGLHTEEEMAEAGFGAYWSGGMALREVNHGLRGLSNGFHPGTKRQQAAAAGAPRAPEDAPAADEGIEWLQGGAFDSTLLGSSGVPYQRHVKPRTGDASTSTAPHTIKSGSKFNKHSSLIDYKLKISTNLCMKHVLTIKLMEKSVEAEEKSQT